MKSSVLVVGIGLVLAVAASAFQAPVEPAAVVRDYKKLKDLTPKGFIVDPGLAMLCRGASAQEVKAAEKQNGPHTYALVHVYVNPKAERALKTRAKTFPIDAVVVKEKEAFPAHAGPPLVRRNGVTGMIKRAPGYDPKNGDWEYFIQEEGGKVERGKIATCVGCHAKAKGPDHLFGTWRMKPGK